MHWFFDLIKREFKLFFTNNVVIAIFIGAPIAYGLLIGFVYQKGKPVDIPILVVDHDQSALGDMIIDGLADNEYLMPEVMQENTEDVAKRIMTDKYAAVITIPEHFEADILQKRHPEIVVDINTANIVPANYAARGIQLVLGTFNAGFEIEALKKSGVPAAIAKNSYDAFGVNYARHFNKTANYMTYLWPGMVGTVMQQVFLLALALSFAREFEEGTFGKILNHTRSSFVIIILKSIPFVLLGLLMWAVVSFMFPMFQVPYLARPVPMGVVITLFTMAVMALGIFFSIAIPNQLKATEVLMVIATPSFIISGFTWPLTQMPVWVQMISKCTPLTHFLSAYRKLNLYGAGLNDVWPEISALFTLTMVFYLSSLLMLHVRIKRKHL